MTSFGKFLLTIIAIILLSGAIFFLNKKAPKIEPISTIPDIIQPEIMGNKDDLVFFSITSGSEVSGLIDAYGIIKSDYFFEGNLPISVLDANKNILRMTNGAATTDWMTIEPVSFKTSLDLTGLPFGPAYIQIHNDNPSGLPENDKFILVPIVIN